MWHQSGADFIQRPDWIETSMRAYSFHLFLVLAVSWELSWGCQLVLHFSSYVTWTSHNIGLDSKEAEVTDLKAQPWE